MIPMEPGPEDFARQLAERRVRMDQARAIAKTVHSRKGLLARFLSEIVDRFDPTGATRRSKP
jgi:hypothetical protein